jgi:hypothetical protein
VEEKRATRKTKPLTKEAKRIVVCVSDREGGE